MNYHSPASFAEASSLAGAADGITRFLAGGTDVLVQLRAEIVTPDTLIDLITSTIAPETWDAVGGPGAIESFPTGVYVDAKGTLKRIAKETGGQYRFISQSRLLLR